MNDLPAAYYRLGDRGSTAVDTSGHNRNATVSAGGTGVTRGTPGLLGRGDTTSTTFNGDTLGNITTARYAALEPTNDVSLEAWTRLTAATQNAVSAVAAYGNRGYRLAFNNARGTYSFSLSLTSGTIVLTTAGPHTSDAIHHLVGTYDGSVAMLYVDGKLAGRQNASGKIIYDDSRHLAGLVIGNDASASAATRAAVQEVAVYHAALSAATVASHFIIGTTTGPGPSPSPTVSPSPSPTFSPSPSPKPSPTTPFQFIVGQPQINYLNGTGAGSPTPDPMTISLLNGTHPYMLLSTLQAGNKYPASDCSGASQIAPFAWQAFYMIRFTSEAEEEAQFASGGVPACVSWIMYDNEPNTQPSTPAIEQLDPPKYMLRAAYIAHAYNKRFMATAGDGVPALIETLYSFASQYDAYDEQNQTGECPSVSHFVSHMIAEASNFQRYNRNIAMAVGFGDAVGTNCYNNIPGPGGILEYVPPAYVEPYLQAFPSNVAAWGNYGAKTSGNNGGGTPAYYNDWSTTVRATVNAPARLPLPIVAPTPTNTNTPIPTFRQLQAYVSHPVASAITPPTP